MSDSTAAPDSTENSDGAENSESTAANGGEDLRDVIEEVESKHGREGAGSMADALRGRTEETQQEEEDPAELHN